jgi:hypothetical protein
MKDVAFIIRGGNGKFMALKVSGYSLREFCIIYSLSIPT